MAAKKTMIIKKAKKETAEEQQKTEEISTYKADEKIDKIKIEINDKQIEVNKGITILEAARQYNIHIPSLCYHEDLCVAGICRICVVEIEGEKNLKTA